jgi:hypothetical protein
MAGRRAANMIDLLVQRQGHLAAPRHRIESHRATSGFSVRIRLVRRSIADWLADEHDMDAAGQFGVDLQDLPDLAVLPVGGLRTGVLQRQAGADRSARAPLPA